MVALPSSYQFLKGGSCHLVLARMFYFRVYCISGQFCRDEGVECLSLCWSSVFFPPCYADLSAKRSALLFECCSLGLLYVLV